MELKPLEERDFHFFFSSLSLCLSLFEHLRHRERETDMRRLLKRNVFFFCVCVHVHIYVHAMCKFVFSLLRCDDDTTREPSNQI